jgi:hypothetical protein
MVGLLLVIFFSGANGQAPPGEHAVALGALGLWLVVPLGWWIDRHREPIAFLPVRQVASREQRRRRRTPTQPQTNADRSAWPDSV